MHALLQIPKPRNYSALAYQGVYDERRAAFVRALENAGLSPAQIRAELAKMTRQQKKLRRHLEDVRGDALGDTYMPDLKVRRRELHGSVPAQRRELERLMREKDQAFLDFLDGGEELDVPYDEMINEWFSPEAA